mmetsp:Transcript_12695/g.29704  ORF Transcript_12695/g.29704 Transcript_12695/m.29704 type:complete len:297 (+) Transcript_12695:48-938(+)
MNLNISHLGTPSRRKAFARRCAVSSYIALGMMFVLSSTIPAASGFSSPHNYHLQYNNNNIESNHGKRDNYVVCGVSRVDNNCEDATNCDRVEHSSSRRGFVASATALTFLPWAATTANAFENRLDDKYANAIPQTGVQPKDLGHSERSNYVGLKECANSPNCWNSSAPKANNPSRWLPAWQAPSGASMEDVKNVIDTYQVGQNNVDGGGFKVIEYINDKKTNEQYLYVQFQSYKAGYIDDFECWFNPEIQKYDVRSSSRIGYSDLGVNAIRLEYIANRLEKEHGWTFERRKNGKLV